jgi:ribosomal protein S6--L-glutamate ligase
MSVAMRLCFIIEERYHHESMPLAVVHQLRRWGHDVDLLERHVTVTPLFDLVAQRYEAYVLKTAAEGPGLGLLEAAEAVGIPTIYNAPSIRLVRDKAVAIAVARAHGLPILPTYFGAHPRLLAHNSRRTIRSSSKRARAVPVVMSTSESPRRGARWTVKTGAA